MAVGQKHFRLFFVKIQNVLQTKIFLLRIKLLKNSADNGKIFGVVHGYAQIGEIFFIFNVADAENFLAAV